MADALPGYIGQSVPRREDKHLLLGEGAFVADMQLPGMLHVAIARSHFPHALIKSVDLTAARAADGVELAICGADIRDVLPQISGMQVTTPQGWRDRVDTDILIPDQPLIPHDKLRFVGEPYAFSTAFRMARCVIAAVSRRR